MVERIKKFLYNLTTLHGLAGHEKKVREYMTAEFEKLDLETRTDVFGNCIAKISGTGELEPVMIFAHMDSLGFMVSRIEDDGFLRLERLGGIPEKVLPALKVSVLCENGEEIMGVVGSKSHHITPPEEKYQVLRYPSLFVDIGATSKEQVLELGIDIGSPVVYKPDFNELQNNRIQATAIDDRGGCAALLELAQHLAKNPPKADTYLVGTVQEEYNLRGAMMASRSIKPKVAISIDCALGGDTPDLKGSGSTKLGGGPVMTLYNFHGRGTLNGTIAHPAMVRLMKQAAKKSEIEFQRAAYIGGLTDMAYLQLEEQGVIGIDVGWPMRYSHSPIEVCDLNDLAALVKLIETAVHLIDENTDWTR